MPVDDQSLGQAERFSMTALEPELRTHVEVTEVAFNLLGTALARVPDAPVSHLTQSQKVTNVLLIRLANDLRTAALLSLRGYAIQANTLVSSMFEVAYTIAFIGASEDLAQEWINHGDPTRPFKRIKKLIEGVVRKLRLPEPKEIVSRQYQLYSQLCMVKHANPSFQKEHGIRLEEGEWVSAVGPDHSEAAVRAAWFALEHGTGLVEVALLTFLQEILAVPGEDQLNRELADLSKQRKRLNDAAVARFGTEDPFPGKWRV